MLLILTPLLITSVSSQPEALLQKFNENQAALKNEPQDPSVNHDSRMYQQKHADEIASREDQVIMNMPDEDVIQAAMESGPPKQVEKLPKDPNELLHYLNEEIHDEELLSESKICGAAAHQHCPAPVLKNNFLTLRCLSLIAGEGRLDEHCSDHLWDYKQSLSHNVHTERTAFKVCFKDILSNHPECKLAKKGTGELVSCMMQHRQEETVQPTCKNFLTQLASIIYSDYTLIGGFVTSCNNDVNKYQCGRVEHKNNYNKKPHSQGETVACLQDKLTDGHELTKSCERAITDLAEQQSDDWQLDRNLYNKCLEDRNRLCSDIENGQGRIYRCLFRNKFSPKMSKNCKTAINLRERVVSRSVKASYSLRIMCAKPIAELNCDEEMHETGFGSSVEHEL